MIKEDLDASLTLRDGRLSSCPEAAAVYGSSVRCVSEREHSLDERGVG